MPRLDLDLPDSINDTTVPPAEPLARTGQGPPLTKALVILACTSEPHRAGEVAYLPEDGSVLYVGRGDEEPETRAAFHPQQPGKHPIAAPLRGRGLSRLAAAMRLGRGGDPLRAGWQLPRCWSTARPSRRASSSRAT